jgi:hypothetical protein
MDLFDIGSDLGYIGQIKQVKILGALAVNDVNTLPGTYAELTSLGWRDRLESPGDRCE